MNFLATLDNSRCIKEMPDVLSEYVAVLSILLSKLYMSIL